MGSKSRSSSSQSTNNYSTTFGIQGPNNGQVINGNGNTITDGGAFKIVGDFANSLPGVFKDALFTADNLGNKAINASVDLADIGARQNETFLRDSIGFLGDMNQTQTSFLRSAFDGVNDFATMSATQTENFINAAGHNAETAISSNERVTTEALKQNAGLLDTFGGYLENANNNNSDLAKFSIDSGNDLADRLTTSVLEADARNDEQTLSILQRNTDSILNFAENYSRSDGAALAQNNNKTMLYTLAGAAVLAGAVIVAGRKS